MAPSKGQSKVVATDTHNLHSPFIAATFLSSSKDSATVLRVFDLLCDSLAERTKLIQSGFALSAFSAPLKLGMSATDSILSFQFLLNSSMTSAASAIWGMALGLTNEVTSITEIPVFAKSFMNFTLSSVGIKSFTLWKPSLGHTSRIIAELGA
ncbi:hypothetical protein SDC9_107835 [bioreactor metagenome]|uniref:Uncharacterized protein n=1 Tax=bioreactor metagenome TaxID=1076179 RepID=A0A645B8M2_9ZZZZ